MAIRMCGHCGQAIPMTFGQRLKRVRSDRKLLLSDVRRLTGVETSNLSRYECSKASPQVKTVKKIAEGLGVSVKWLLNGNGAGVASD